MYLSVTTCFRYNKKGRLSNAHGEYSFQNLDPPIKIQPQGKNYQADYYSNYKVSKIKLRRSICFPHGSHIHHTQR